MSAATLPDITWNTLSPRSRKPEVTISVDGRIRLNSGVCDALGTDWTYAQLGLSGDRKWLAIALSNRDARMNFSVNGGGDRDKFMRFAALNYLSQYSILPEQTLCYPTRIENGVIYVDLEAGR